MRIYCDSSHTEACFVVEGQEPVIVSYLEVVTNNVGEYKAVILVLEYAKVCELEDIEVFTDSEFVVNQVRGYDKHGQIWKRCKPHLLPYRDKTRQLVRLLNAKLDWIPREENLAGKVLE